MGSLDVYYLFEHDESPVVVATAEDVDALIDRVRSESPREAPILMDVHLSGDPYTQGLDVGVSDGRGVVRYAGRDWPRGVVSVNEQSSGDEEVAYFYMGHWRGFPANAEIPLELVRAAVKEFMESGGARPTCIRWQPEPWGVSDGS
ncbi:Immunity protein Imm1 [Streptoalloteichus tenebrarius]|uniref:Immunity protein Imm1 n=1 Tax=Streptoalloteichus tenebrarius (strain ATCC 17920 / DSM 40477 / JCM 4838 / CBS 697.72 / NBRC 16177 / NCIMB 11028 / NRRL B-12390 / A12253. 1 / ISP 5477) TaxID=1933 RepID=A0ABT1HZ91_STRSD|nr:Imm1 family immunity protein [Streptoalloteichus tenebrarius]MCP2260675.1 Immunity protein Imm1 [Streptoalloteichus tenebrarius]BFF03793.1 Imm1 family immunity protein [Streptoalloteichus tenebrarius]